MRPTFPLVSILRCALLSLHLGAWAQGVPPSQVTPPTLRPPAPVEPDIARVPRLPEPAAAEGSDTLFVTPGAFAIETDSPGLLALPTGFELPPPGTRLSVANLFALAVSWERAFVRAGYPLVRVVLPAQSVVDGATVRFAVVDGFIETLDVQGVPVALRELVSRRLQPLVGVRHLTQAELERRLLLAGGVAGLSLRSTLAAGAAPGATQLILDGQQTRVSGLFNIDNRLGAALGRWEFGPTIALNSALGLGEQVYATLRSGTQARKIFGGDPPLRILAAGVVLPVGNDGASAALEFTDSSTHAMPAPGAVDTVGRLQRSTLRGAYPVLLGRSQSLNLGLAIEYLAQASHAPQFGVDLSNDRYTVLRGTMDAAGALGLGAQVSATLALSGGLGGRDASDAAQTGVPLSRQGASPTFHKLGAIVDIKQGLPAAGWRVDLSLAGQTGFGHAMLQSEQFSLDGISLVSGLPSGALSVDSGAAVRAELQRSMALGWGTLHGVFTPYGFAAWGHGIVKNPTALETASVTGRSGGVGLRSEALGNANGANQSLALEWARCQSNAADLEAGQRLTLIYVLSF